MENNQIKELDAKLHLEIPGLNQRFVLYREQVGRCINLFSDACYRPTYEAVYESEGRSATKLIFQSAEEKNRPLRAEEMLAMIPEDMMQYLVQTLNQRWAVVTFSYNGEEVGYTINFDCSELWEQEESILSAEFRAMEHELKALGPYCIVHRGTMDRVPGSTTGNYPVPHVGVFWVIDEEVVAVKEPWKPNETPSAECFDHRVQWGKLPVEVTGGKAFDHYPKGMVEIKGCKATVQCHHSLIHAPYPVKIAWAFGIPFGSARFLIYGYHKEYINRIYPEED